MWVLGTRQMARKTGKSRKVGIVTTCKARVGRFNLGTLDEQGNNGVD